MASEYHAESNGPMITLVLEPVLLSEKCSVEIFPEGLVISRTLGTVKTNRIGARRVSDLMAELADLGFPDMDQRTLETEYVAAAVKAGQWLAIADGMTVTLTIRTASKKVTISWPEPRMYSETYPSAAASRAFVHGTDLVQAAVPQP